MDTQLQQEVIHQLLPAIMGTILFVGIAIGFWWLISNKHKGQEFGEVFNFYMARYPISILVALALGIVIAQGLWAGSIEDKDSHVQIPAFVRYIGHVTVMIASMTFLSMGIRRLPHALTYYLKTNKEDWTKNFIITLFTGFIQVVIVSAFLFAGIWLPYMNTNLIANGLNQTMQVELYFASWSPFTSVSTYEQMLAFYGKSRSYSPWQDMSYGMATDIVLLFTHYVLVVGDFVLTYDRNYMTTKELEEAEKESKKKKSQQNGPGGGSGGGSGGSDGGSGNSKNAGTEAGVISSVKKILKFYGDSDSKFPDRENAVNAAMSLVGREKITNLLQPLAKFIVKIEAIEALDDGDTKTKQTKDLIDEIYNHFKLAPRNGGLGITLPAPKND